MNIEEILREYITKTYHMSLSTVRDNKPWTSEVHFAYDDDLNLYFRSLTSRRHSQEITDNENVSGNIVRQYELDEVPVGVYFEGIAKELTDTQDIESATKVIAKCLKKDDEQAIIDEAKSPEGHHIYKIAVKNYYVFGKFDTPHGVKYTIEWGKL
jgi:uncharacterized protein YhbP (UPF0306 family)